MMKTFSKHTFMPEYFLAIFTGLMALINLVSAVTPALADRLQWLEKIFPLEVRFGTRLATALAGFALVLLTVGIWRRKRTAWLITLIVLTLSSGAHLIKGFDFEEASLSFALVLFFIIFRKRFLAQSDPPTIQRGLAVLGIAVGFTLFYGMIGFFILDRHFSIKFSVWDAAVQTGRMFINFSDPGLIATTRFGKYFADSIYLIAIATLGYALIALLTPVLIRETASFSHLSKAKSIILQYGQSVLARFCLFPDKQFYFSSGGSVIAYIYKNRVALVLGDPIGPGVDLSSSIREFKTYCTQNDWIPAFYQTRHDTVDAYRQENMRAIKIGEEALVNLNNFTLQGGDMKSLRTSVNKFSRLGFTQTISQPPHNEDLLHELKEISNEWLQERKAKEMKYSLGWFDLDYLNTTPLLVIRNLEGKSIAFVNLVDEYQSSGLAVDLMRHRSDAPSGTMDFLFVMMLQYAKEQGYQRFNLGLSGLAGVGESSDDPVIEKAIHYIYTHIDTTYNFKGLHAYKEKFSPEWFPRYLIYPGISSLPAVALALSEVSS